MRISNISQSYTTFKSFHPVVRLFDESSKKRFYEQNQSRATIFSFKEVEDMYNFAKENINDNIALRVIDSPVIDCKLLKTQSDLIAKTGEWLDITDCSCM